METIGPEFTTWLTQFCILASKLPGRSRALPLRCPRCGHPLGGLVANDAAVVHGRFEPDIKINDAGCAIGTKLVGYTIFLLTCGIGAGSRRSPRKGRGHESRNAGNLSNQTLCE